MVVLLHSCKNCTHKEFCDLREDYEKIHEETNKIVNNASPSFIYSASVYIRCSLFETDYGKGIGL